VPAATLAAVRPLAVGVSALVLVLAAAGCGGGGSSSRQAQSHSVLAVSKAFSDAGIPFSTIVTSNPYVAGQVVYLPGKLNTSSLRNEVQAELSSLNGYSGVEAVVFDTDAHAAKALSVVPLAKWAGNVQPPVSRVHDGNVIVVATGFQGAAAKKLQAALASLKG
jgi:hypothetical protein